MGFGAKPQKNINNKIVLLSPIAQHVPKIREITNLRQQGLAIISDRMSQ